MRDGLQHAVRVLRERWPIVAIVALPFAIVGVLVDQRVPSTYLASAAVELRPVNPEALFFKVHPDVPAEHIAIQARRAANQAFTRSVQQSARRRLGPGFARYGFGGRVVATTRESAGVVSVGVVDTDRRRAARAANALAEAVVSRVRWDTRRRLNRAIAAARSSRPTHFDSSDDIGVLADLERRLSDMRVMRDVADPAVLTARATPPTTALPAREVKWTQGLLGLSLGLVAAFVVDGIARRSRDPRRMAVEAGLPLAGVLHGRRPDRRPENFERLLFDVERFTGSGPARVAVTGPATGAPCESVARGLAAAAERSGRADLEVAVADSTDLLRDADLVLVCARAGGTPLDELADRAAWVGGVARGPVALVVQGAAGYASGTQATRPMTSGAPA